MVSYCSFSLWELKLVWVAPKVSRLRNQILADARRRGLFLSSKLSQLFFNHTVNLMVASATPKNCITPLQRIEI